MAKLALLSCGATDIRNHGSPSRLNITWLNRCDATDVGGVGHSGNFGISRRLMLRKQAINDPGVSRIIQTFGCHAAHR